MRSLPSTRNSEEPKFPIDRNWHERALQNPPACIAEGPNGYPWTGIATSGLQAADIDIEDADDACIIAGWCLSNVGDAPMRMRDDKSRMLLLYRAPDLTAPGKIKV